MDRFLVIVVVLGRFIKNKYKVFNNTEYVQISIYNNEYQLDMSVVNEFWHEFYAILFSLLRFYLPFLTFLCFVISKNYISQNIRLLAALKSHNYKSRIGTE